MGDQVQSVSSSRYDNLIGIPPSAFDSVCSAGVSLKAIGAMLLLRLGYENLGSVSVRSLAQALPDGKYSVMAALQELEAAGLASRHQNRTPKGKLLPTSWTLDWQKFVDASPCPGFPDTDNPDTVLARDVRYKRYKDISNLSLHHGEREITSTINPNDLPKFKIKGKVFQFKARHVQQLSMVAKHAKVGGEVTRAHMWCRRKRHTFDSVDDLMEFLSRWIAKSDKEYEAAIQRGVALEPKEPERPDTETEVDYALT